MIVCDVDMVPEGVGRCTLNGPRTPSLKDFEQINFDQPKLRQSRGPAAAQRRRSTFQKMANSKMSKATILSRPRTTLAMYHGTIAEGAGVTERTCWPLARLVWPFHEGLVTEPFCEAN